MSDTDQEQPQVIPLRIEKIIQTNRPPGTPRNRNR